MRTIKYFAVAAFTALALTACQKNEFEPNKGKDETSAKNTEKSAFTVRMTDAPGDYAALDVEIASVAVFSEDSGWVMLNNESQFVSVLDLTNGNETALASNTEVDAGFYTMVKLTFGTDNTLTLNGDGGMDATSDNVEFDAQGNAMIELDGLDEREIIVEINQQASAEAEADILLDFQVAQSIEQEAETFIIDPMITVVRDESTGVQGQVEGAAGAAIVLTDGEDTFSTYIDAQGNFLIRGMQDGTYTLLADPAQEEDNGFGIDLNILEPQTLEGVVITQGEISQVGVIQF